MFENHCQLKSFKSMLIQIMFKNSAPAAKTTQYVSITKISWLILLEIVISHSKNHTLKH